MKTSPEALKKTKMRPWALCIRWICVLLVSLLGFFRGPELLDVVRSGLAGGRTPAEADLRLRGLAGRVSSAVREETLLGHFIVTPEEPIVTVGEIRVDFGSFQVTEPFSLRVATVPPRFDPASGMHAQPFRLSPGEVKAFPLAVEVTLPYVPVDSAGSDRPASVMVAKLNQDGTGWEMYPTHVDPVNRSVTFYTRSFSTFAVLQNTLSQGRVFYYPGGEYQGPATPVAPCLESLIRQVNELDMMPFELLIRGEPVPAGSLVANGMSLVNVIASGTSYAYSFSEWSASPWIAGTLQQGMADRFSRFGNLALAFKVMEQWCRGVTPETIIRDNAFSLLEALAGGAAATIGGPYLTVCAGGLWLAGIGDAVINRPVGLNEDIDIMEKVYRLSTPHIVVYDPRNQRFQPWFDVQGRGGMPSGFLRMNERQAWVSIILQISEETRGNPGEIKRRMEALVKEYSDAFWAVYHSRHFPALLEFIDTTLIPFHRDFRGQQGIIARNLPWPRAYQPGLHGRDATPVTDEFARRQATTRIANVQRFRERMVTRTHLELQPLYQRAAEELRRDMYLKLYQELLGIAELMNQEMVFELEDPALTRPGFARSAYAGHVFYLRTNGNYQQDFRLRERHRDSDRVFVCNLYHYLTAGMPEELYVLPPGTGGDSGGYLHTQATHTVRFSPRQPVTTIALPEHDDIMDYLLPAANIPQGLVEYERRNDSEHAGVRVEIAVMTLRSVDYDAPIPEGVYRMSHVVPLGQPHSLEQTWGRELYPGAETTSAPRQPEEPPLLRISVHKSVSRVHHSLQEPLIQILQQTEVPSLRKVSEQEWATPADAPEIVRIRRHGDFLISVRCSSRDARARSLVDQVYAAAFRHVRDRARHVPMDIQQLHLPTDPGSFGVSGDTVPIGP